MLDSSLQRAVGAVALKIGHLKFPDNCHADTDLFCRQDEDGFRVRVGSMKVLCAVCAESRTVITVPIREQPQSDAEA